MIKRRHHRGLTLLEVLASLVIIAMLAGVCVPMLRSAAAVIGGAPRLDSSESQLDLEALADACVLKPSAFGVASLDDLTMAQVSSPDSPTLGAATVVRLTRDGEAEETEWNHEWLVFRDGANLAIRCHESAPKKDSKEVSP